MTVYFDKEKFSEKGNEIKEKYSLHSIQDLEKLQETNAKELSKAVEESTVAFEQSVIGKNFEELTEDEMLQLQAGAGDINPETTPVCFIGGVGVGVIFSIKYC